MWCRTVPVWCRAPESDKTNRLVTGAGSSGGNLLFAPLASHRPTHAANGFAGRGRETAARHSTLQCRELCDEVSLTFRPVCYLGATLIAGKAHAWPRNRAAHS